MPDYYSTAKQRPHPNSRVAWPWGNREWRGVYDGRFFYVSLGGQGVWPWAHEPPARWRYLKLDER